jgi:hypothetical protein
MVSDISSAPGKPINRSSFNDRAVRNKNLHADQFPKTPGANPSIRGIITSDAEIKLARQVFMQAGLPCNKAGTVILLLQDGGGSPCSSSSTSKILAPFVMQDQESFGRKTLKRLPCRIAQST